LTGTSYNNSSAVTIATNATSENTASTLVARNASGGFSAGTITANLSGTASYATALQTARTINGVSFDGSANITITEFDTGTAILFYQASAPTGWTKSTTHNNKALRVVSGDGGGSGGSMEFTSVFTTRTPSGSVSGTNSGGSVAAHALTVEEMPHHSHGTHHHPNGPGTLTGTGLQMTGGGGTDGTGGGQAHSHGFTNPSWTGSFTGIAMDFAVQYIDVIICTKN
jgi:hypothetical protein